MIAWKSFKLLSLWVFASCFAFVLFQKFSTIKSMVLQIYTDGGSLGNPGPSAYGFVIYTNGSLLFQEGKPIGEATNNIAEYTALIEALKKTRDLLRQKHITSLKKIEVFADSQLLVQQVNGLYKVKKPHIRDLLMGVRVLEGELNVSISYTFIPREQNHIADSLVKQALFR